MKIFQILPELNSGGVELCVMELSKYLASQGHEAVIISNGGRMVESLAAMNVRHLAMPVHRKSPASLLQVRRMRKLLEQEKPDIVHIHSRVPGWITYLAWRNMDPLTRPRLVSTVHGFYSVSPYSAVMTKGERVIAVSRCILDYIIENYPKTNPSKTQVIYGGIEPELYPKNFAPSAEWQETWKSAYPHLTGKTIFILPGRITRLKGHGDFFALIDKLKEEDCPIHGLVVGDTHPKKKDYLKKLEAILAEKKLSNDVSFLGYRSDVREIMAVSDVVCALSQQPESFGRTVLEALALGKPVLGYDCGGVGELLSAIFPEGKVPLGDSAKLLTKARKILASNHRPQLAEGSFTINAMCDSTMALYAELTSSSSSP
jgi:glycosyltransferase involved in cell wall biosynthesis